MLGRKTTAGLKETLRRWRFGPKLSRLADETHAIHSLDHLRPLLDGKRVALVGNAASILSAGHGPEIDAHDTVLRFNRGYIRDPAHQGRRTDILGVARKMSSGEVRRHFGHPELLWLSANLVGMSSAFLSRGDSIVMSPRPVWDDLLSDLDGGRPSSGIMAIALLRRHFNPAAITLFGFDWKLSPTYYESSTDPRQQRDGGPHAWDAEQRLVQLWAAEDPRLTIR